MYIRKSIRSYKGRTYTNYVLVESVHTAKGPRQKTICSLGDLSPRPRQAWIELARKIENALIGQSDFIDTDESEVANIVDRVRSRRRNQQRRDAEPPPPPPPPPANSSALIKGALIKVDPTQVSTERHREAGPVHVGYQFWQRLELDRILREAGLSATMLRLACAMVLNRLIAPASEHAMPAWLRRTALGDLLGADFDTVQEDPLYKVLDQLHPHRAAIEAALVERSISTISPRPISKAPVPAIPKPSAATRAIIVLTASRWWSPWWSIATALPSLTRCLPAIPKTAPRSPPCSICSQRAPASRKATP
jgi:hypothetical protein